MQQISHKSDSLLVFEWYLDKGKFQHRNEDIMRKKQITLLVFALLFFCISVLSASETILKESFQSDSDHWQDASNRHIRIVNGELINTTNYASRISLKEQGIGNFKLSFRLKFLKGSEAQLGHFFIRIDRGYGSWYLYFTTNATQSQVTSKFIPKMLQKEPRLHSMKL